jgi:hypothetical protein
VAGLYNVKRTINRKVQGLLAYVAGQTVACYGPQPLIYWTLLHGKGDVSTSHCLRLTQQVHEHVTGAKEH